MIIEKFTDIVRRFPTNTALKINTDSLTYAELHFNSNKAAHALTEKDKNIAPGIMKQQVALLFNYGTAMITALLGALKANKTYVPLDSSYPGKRLLSILKDSQTYLILTDTANFPLARELSCYAETEMAILNIETIDIDSPGIPGTDVEREASPGRNAYILYTSGSTGKPKGVYQTHRNVIYYARNWIKRFNITEADRVSLFTAFTHDGAIPDIYSALLSGACLYPYALKETGRVDELHALAANEKITLWHSTPTLFRYFTGALANNECFPHVRWVMLGGEPVRAHDLELYKSHFTGALFVNVYGQTESTLSSLCILGPQATFEDVTIGEPLDETKIFLMDEDGDLIEEMGAGEIVVASNYIAPGYWQDNENSANVFLNDTNIGRFYRTGDLGRFTTEGFIKVMGRIDFQVKIRGFRIELGEIETALLRHYGVKEAIVTVQTDEKSDNYLCAYIVSGQAIVAEDLRDYLFDELPDYMTPRHFIFLEKMPLTSSGKIDRRRLPEPGVMTGYQSAYAAPSNEIEEKVTAIWQEVLKVDKIGVNDNFTELGGHSLLVMSITAKIHRALNVELQLTDVFKNPTIRELSRLIMISKQTVFSAIEPAEKKEYYPLSSAQKRLYILQQMNPDITAYHLPEIIPLPVEFDWRKLEETFKKLIKRHESLRTSFHMVNDIPVQVVHNEVEFEIEQLGIRDRGLGVSRGDPLWSSFIRPFDLSRAPLLRVGLVKNNDGSYTLLMDMHHIIMDGISNEILVNDYQTLYNEEDLPPLRLQYKDFSEWQNSEREKETLKRQEEYWLTEFGGELPALDLPTDYPRPPMHGFEGNRVNFEISAEEIRALNALALKENVTLFMVLAAVFNILLAKLSGQEEIIIGTPIAGRRHEDLEKIIGMFVNTLALRNYPAGYRTFREFLGDVKERLLTVFENQEYPFEALVDKLSLDRDIARNPIFDIMFALQNMKTGSPVQPAFPNEYKNVNQTVKFDLTLIANEKNDGISLFFQYSTRLFKKETIERFAMYFKKILSMALQDPGIRLSEIETVPEEEKKRVLYDFNDTEAEYPKDKTIRQLFEEQVEKTPANIAVVGGGQRVIQIAYRELNNRSNHIANRLRSKAVKRGAIIGIMVEPTLEMAVGIVGILKAGCVFLPMEPGSPVERINFVLNDGNAGILLTQPHLSGAFKTHIDIINIEDTAVYTGESQNTESGAGPADPVYVIYTSGTTGRPKGVLVADKNLVNYVYWFVQTTRLTANDRAILTSSFAFDALYTQFFSSLLTGGQLHVIPRETFLFAGPLLNYLGKNKITYIKVTPSLFNLIANSHEFSSGLPGTLRFIMLGGEEINVNDVEKAHKICPHVSMMNHYGPTETTIGSIARFLDFDKFTEYKIAPTIGKPIYNTRVYILDKNRNIVPTGVVGGLFIGGDGVGMGYLNKPELTAEKFNRDLWDYKDDHDKKNKSFFGGLRGAAFSKKAPLVYKTGDLARWHSDGNIEFLGRADHQVKIRGYRIEPGEIENRLLKYNDVKEAAVMVRQKKNGEKYLCAYYVSAKKIEVTSLREFLSGELPQPMIPSYFVQLEKMPLTRHNKLNRGALPEPSLEGTGGYTAPANRLEAKLVETWADVLGIEKEIIGIDDNFFQLGGHSLKATILVSKIHKEFNVKVPLAEIFKTPRIKELAKYIKGKIKESHISMEPAEEKEYYQLSPAQKRLYILQQMVTDNTGYNMHYVIPFDESAEKEKLESAFKRLIERHESLRTSFITVNEKPVQRVHREVDFSIGYYEVGEEVEVVALIPGFIKPFKLDKAPLLRVNLIAMGASRRVLFIDMHHIITDGTSQGILAREFRALLEGEALHPLHLQCKDYSEWYNGTLRREAIKQQESYWLKEFPGELPVLDLPTDYPRPIEQGFDGNTVMFSLTSRETGVLKTMAKENDVTLYMTLLAVFNILFAKLSGQEDIIIGTPIAARRHADLQDVIGMLVGTLAMRNYPSGEKPFNAFLREVKQRTLEAYENQEYPFEDLVEKILVNRDTGRNPVFDVMLNLLNQWPPTSTGDSREFEDHPPYRHQKGTSRFDMAFSAMEQGERIIFGLEYSTRLFTPATIDRFIRYLKTIVLSLPRNMDQKLSTVEFIPAGEKQDVLRMCNGVEELGDRAETIHRLFEEQVEKRPDHIALVGSNLDGMHLSYKELNGKANRLAHLLRGKGIGPDKVVGLMAERSIEMIIAVLAIIKAGGAYLPMDAEYPAERVLLMLDDATIPVLLTQEKILAQSVGKMIENNYCLPGPDVLKEIPGLAFSTGSYGNREIVLLDHIMGRLNQYPAVNPTYINRPDDLLYLIYTSGSTGMPKGVLVEHRNLVNLFKFQFKYTNIDCSRILQFSTISFDASFHEIFSAFLSGGRLFLVDKETRTDIPRLFGIIERNEINTVFLPISFLKVIFKEEEYIKRLPRSIRHIQTAGEQVVVSANFKNFLREKKVYLHNHYGPSETHVVTTLTVDPGGDIAELPSIGKPVMNTGIYIMDKFGQLLPPGVAGEIRIGGAQVGRGYLNRPELTAEKFYRSNRTYKTYTNYKTGDLGRFLSDGNIEFLGRIDHQVKIRGFRVEPGEIENRLAKYRGIKQAVVLGREEENRDKYLCAYIVSAGEIDIPKLREYLTKELPDYMIPAYFVQVEKMPLTVSGKIDRNALPKPGLKVGDSYTAPRDEFEKKLLGLWSETLAGDTLNASQLQTSIGIDDNFFQLGGHSLKATILVSRIEKVFNVKMPLAEVFKTPRIRELAGYIKDAARLKYNRIELVEKKEYYVLSSAQKRLYFLQQMEKDGTAYNIPSIMILEGAIDKDKLEQAIAKVIRRHESLRTSFVITGEEPVQRINGHVAFEIEYKDLATDKHGQARTFLINFIRPFDLSKAPLLRVELVKLGEEKHLFLVDMHHIISDGMSSLVLVRDFSALYAGKELPGIKLQYKDYAEWQNREKAGKNILEQGEYWKKEYEGEIPVLMLPTDYMRPAVQSFEGDHINFEISSEISGALRALALETGTTLFMVLVALYVILLAKLSSREDIVIGTPVAGRRHADLEKIIGMFVNTVALRNYPSGEKGFVDFLGEVKEIALKGFENQEYQYEDLVEQISVSRDVGRNPLFDTMFALQNTGSQEIEIPGLKLAPYESEIKTSKFDLTLAVVEADEKLYLTFTYCTKLFKQETIEHYLSYFVNIIQGVIENRRKRISDYEIITAEEKRQILFDFNDTEAEYPKDKTIHRLFEEQVEKSPDHIAVIGSTAVETLRAASLQITYRHLNEQSNRLAGVLFGKGVQPDTIVGIMVERSVEMIIGMMGILKSGGAYLPIDPDYPRERIDYMLKDSAAKLLVTTNDKDGETVRRWEGKKVLLEEIFKSPKISSYPLTLLPSYPLNSSNLSYVIYTSGSTGRPKGVAVEHFSVVNLAISQKNQFAVNERDRVLQFSSICFDASVEQIFITFFSGAVLLLVDKNTLLDNIKLEKLISSRLITHIHAVPSFLDNISLKEGYRLKRVISGGDICPPALAMKYGAYCDFYNEYGPTETTVTSIEMLCTDANDTLPHLPIGKPIDNTFVYLLDKWLKPVSTGVAGELYIGGDGVTRGYLNNPELTFENFLKRSITKSFCGAFFKKRPAGGNLYKTGDLCKWLPDGNIEFLGRIDRQVKIRGFRIELEEIEKQLINFTYNYNAGSGGITGNTNEVTYCSRCVLPSTYPGIHFDREGVCNICREYEMFAPRAWNYFKTIHDFHQLVEIAGASKKGQYDCMMLFSGGKDSSYVLYRLVEMGLKVLAFTFDNGYISDTALENINRITKRLRVDGIVCTTSKMKGIFVESLSHEHTVCTGCFKALTAISTQIAVEKNINMVITGLSRGQIFDTKLQELYSQDIFDVKEIEEKLLLFRKMYHSGGDKISQLLKDYNSRATADSLEEHRGIPIEVFTDEVFQNIHFVDFFRYDNASIMEIKTYLSSKDSYWRKPGDTGFCSTNCLINDVGIYVYTNEKGYHNYAAPLSWGCRLGKNSREEALSEIEFEPDRAKVKEILADIGYFDRPIRDACVVDAEDKNGNKYLCAYIVPVNACAIENMPGNRELRDYLSRVLPDYMVPSFFVPLAKLPLTANGKIDHKALPEPGLKAGENYTPPGNEIETKLVEIWSEVLGKDPLHTSQLHTAIGIDDNFFQLGGHSLKVITLVSKIHKVFDVKVPLVEIFKTPTIRRLSEFIKRSGEDKYAAIESAEEKEYYPLASAQKRMYVEQQMHIESKNYNVPTVIILEGEINYERLRDTFRHLIKRHESLRTSFVMLKEEAVQIIAKEAAFKIEYFESGEENSRAIVKNFMGPFDLSKAPLLRVGLIRLSEIKHVLMADMHHIISDGVSHQILVEEFSKLYRGEDLSHLRLQYKDFSEWQNRLFAAGLIKKQEEYWLNRFKDNIPILELPTDYPRSTDNISNTGDAINFHIEKEATLKMNELIKNSGITVYMFLLAVYNILLAKFSGQKDIIVVSPITGRRYNELENIIGIFVNMLVMRNRPEMEKTFREFLEEVKENTLDAFENQEYQFPELVGKLNLQGHMNTNPLLNTVFTMQNIGAKKIALTPSTSTDILRIVPYQYERKISVFDLHLIASADDDNGSINLRFEYSTRLFRESTIRDISTYCLEIIDQVLENPGTKIKDITVTSDLVAMKSKNIQDNRDFDF